MTSKSKSKVKAAELAVLFRARNPFIWVVTKEEARVERYIMEAALSVRYIPRTWDVAQGFANLDGVVIPSFGKDDGMIDTGKAFETITAAAVNDLRMGGKPAGRGVWIMRDLAPWLVPPIGLIAQRELRNLVRLLPGVVPDRAQTIVVITSVATPPAELANHATVIEWPLPDREEIGELLDEAMEVLDDNVRASAINETTLDAVIDAAVGLSGEGAISCFAKSLVQTRTIDPAVVAAEKKQAVKGGGLEWYDPLKGGLDAVGGLANLKVWLKKRERAYSKRARERRMPTPKGVLTVGVPGCGKSLMAKAVSTSWGCPLLKMDMGALKSKFVGESEANVRNALRIVEAIGRCVLWIDEIEKALAGATQGAADGGVSSDALGTILNWMQERRGEAFVFATANDISQLPPELLRKGRFDEIWFVDLPTRKGSVEVLKAALAEHGRENLLIDLNAVVDRCKGFSGAEIAALVPDALFTAFSDGEREPTTEDLIEVAVNVAPLSKTAGTKIDALREWAKGRAQPADAEDETATAVIRKGGRMLEV